MNIKKSLSIYVRMDKLGNKIYHTLPPENPLGSVEYKWDLSKMDRRKKAKVTTQMRWRIYEESVDHSGFYVIGVHDNGSLTGIPREKLIDTYVKLMSCAHTIGLLTCLRVFQKLGDGKWWAVVQVFKGNTIDCDVPKIPKQPLPSYLQFVKTK